MSTYCQEGNTARVTFPDGEIAEYLNAPIQVMVEESLHLFRIYNAFEFWSDNGSGGFKAGQGSGYTNIWAEPSDINQPFFKTYNTSPGNIREYSFWINAFRFQNSASKEDIYLRGYQNPLNPFFIKPWFLYNGGADFYEILPFVGNQPLFQPSYTIKVSDRDNNLLKEKTYSSNEYLVECVGCPPNTLDCGDCCLPCDSIFNAISSMRSQLSRIN